MKKTVSIFLLIVVCCTFAPMAVAAVDTSEDIDASLASSVENGSESIHSEGIESIYHRSGESAHTTSIVNPEPAESKFTWGWVAALVILLGAGGVVVLANRIKK